MSSPFLRRFVEQVLNSLEARDGIEIAPGRRVELVVEVSGALGTAGEGKQLVASLSRALLASELVEELYLDDDELKELIGDLDSAWMRF